MKQAAKPYRLAALRNRIRRFFHTNPGGALSFAGAVFLRRTPGNHFCPAGR